MRLFLLFFLLFYLKSGQILAQTNLPLEVETQVYLKDKGVVRGRLLEWKQGEYLTIMTADSVRLQFPEARIDRVKQRRYGGAIPDMERGYAFREEGWYNATTFGFIFNRASDNFSGETRQQPTFFFSNATGYQVNRLLGIGGGFSVDHYGRNELLYFVPIFVDIRTYLTANKRSPYINLMVGKGFPVENKFDEIQSNSGLTQKSGGTFFSPNFGFRLTGNASSNWTIDFGLRLQKAGYTNNSFGSVVIRDILYRRYTVRAGLIF
jgi:hypothetical protein